MADITELSFEIERRIILLHRDTSMPDDTQLGYTGDPNSAIDGNTPGETLLYNSPSGTRYLDKSASPYDLWVKTLDSAGGTWEAEGSGGTGGGDSFVPKYVLTSEHITVAAYGQYVIHGKVAISFDGISSITLNQGSEIIL